MKIQQTILASISVAVLAAGGYGLWALGMQQGMDMMSRPISSSGTTSSNPSNWTIPQGEAATRRHMEQGIQAGDIDPETGLKVLYYHDPMVPGRNFDAPGKSPFMDMMLVPEYAGAGAGGGDSSSVTISPRVQQNLGVRSVAAEVSRLSPEVLADGTVSWNERARSVIQARATGFVENLSVTATLDQVKKGQTLLTLYVPDWVAAQQEYLALLNMKGENLQPLIEAARQRMEQVGMTGAQIRQVQRSGKVQTRLPVLAPRDGVVTELNVRDGMTVQPGMTLLTVNGLDPVWVEAEVPERQAWAVQPGAKVQASSRGLPGTLFEGEVQTVLPQVNTKTRTVLARTAISNPDGQLLPGMFVQMNLSLAAPKESLTVPSQAVIFTGKRAVIMLDKGEGVFEPIEVKTGQEANGRVEILAGLEAGQKVAMSGQFLLDSEATLQGLEARTLEKTPNEYETTVVLDYLDEPGMPMMTHPPIEALGWPTMTMQFELPEAVMAEDQLEEGAEYGIAFRMQEGGVPVITRMQALKQGGGGGQP